MYCMYTITQPALVPNLIYLHLVVDKKNSKFPSDILKDIYCWKYVRVIDLTAWDERMSGEKKKELWTILGFRARSEAIIPLFGQC